MAQPLLKKADGMLFCSAEFAVGADLFSAEQKPQKELNQKGRFFHQKRGGESGFSVEILTDFRLFDFIVCFLAALLSSGVLLYADEDKSTTSAS